MCAEEKIFYEWPIPEVILYFKKYTIFSAKYNVTILKLGH